VKWFEGLAGSAIVQLVRTRSPHPSDPGSSTGGGICVPQTLFVTCISVRRTSYLLFWRDFILPRMGSKLQIASGFKCMDSDWGHIGPCPEPLAYIQSAGRSHASSIGGFGVFLPDHRYLLPTSQSSCVPATPELCERACAMRREVVRGIKSSWLIRAPALQVQAFESDS
jgi:hypothetical protein